MTGALSFLIYQTIRNRLARQIARVRQPRYAIGALLGIAYLWFVFLRPTRPSVRTPSPGLDLSLTSNILAVLPMSAALVWWLKAGLSGALAFQPSEVQMLFPAPLSRRALIGYRIARTQVLILINALFWTFFIRRWGITLSAPLRFATAWSFFSLYSLHRFCAALMQTEPMGPARRVVLWLIRIVVLGLGLSVIAGVAPVLFNSQGRELMDTVRAVVTALTTRPASIGFTPFRIATAPLAAQSIAAWEPAFFLVTALIVAHIVWALGMNIPFEEEAARASTVLAERMRAFRERRAGGAAAIRPIKVKRDWLPLKPRGAPGVSIVWKNTIALARTGALMTTIVLAAVLTIGYVTASMSNRASDANAALITLAAVTIVIGPRVIRNDFRQDLLNMALLKTYPLRGSQLVLAELASPTIMLTGFQVTLMYAGLALSERMRSALNPTQFALIAITGPLLLFAFNAAGVALQNLAALLFPSWVRLGPDSGGFEAIGQNMLVTIGSTLLLVLLLLVPVTAGAAVWAFMKPISQDLAIGSGGVVAALALLGEVALIVVRLGRAFERTEPPSLL